MNSTMKRIMALVLALMLALPAMVLAEDDSGVLSLPESGIILDDQEGSGAG